MQNSKHSFAVNLLNKIMRAMPSVFWILLIFGFDSPYIGVATLICALIHELGHILAILIVTPGFSLKPAISGFRLGTDKTLSYKQEIIIAFAGPLTNIIAFNISLMFGKALNGYLFTFGILNLMTALSNLMPIEGYDGYRISWCLFSLFGYSNLPIKALRCFSFFMIVMLAFLALYFMVRVDGGYWIYFIFITALVKSLSGDRKVFFEKTRENERF